ncbi:MAG: DinB family protein [Thermoanaerobaculia bacterium]
MKRASMMTGVLCLALMECLVQPAVAQEAKKQEAKKEAPAAKPAGERASIVFQIDQAREKLLSLAEAMPAEKFAWRPAEGVRSVGEVFAHVSGANYFLPTFWGAKIPAGVDPRGFEKEGGDKAKTIATLKASFEFLQQQIQAVPDADLTRAIKMFGHDATVADAMLTLASHAHEHLGQSIAYARMNGVTPPWSAQGGQ